MRLGSKLIIVALLELGNVFASAYISTLYPALTPDAEHLRTLMRLFDIAVYYYLFQGYISRIKPVSGLQKSLFLVGALGLLLLTPLLVGNLYFMGDYTRVLFAVSSLAVAVREELTFRVLMQNVLVARIGTVNAIIVTSVVFTLWHYGAAALTWFGFGQVMLASLILGMIYAATQRFLWVVLIHTAYDALWSFTPVYRNVIDVNWGFVPLLAALVLTVLWYRILKTGGGQVSS